MKSPVRIQGLVWHFSLVESVKAVDLNQKGIVLDQQSDEPRELGSFQLSNSVESQKLLRTLIVTKHHFLLG